MAARVVVPPVPRNGREWRIYRRGFLEGVEKSQTDARVAAERFKLRAECGGVALEIPSASDAKPFSSQLKRRRTG